MNLSITPQHACANAQLVIFDWDGTLFDSTGIIGHSLIQACVSIGCDAPSMTQAQQVIGLGFNEAIEHLVGVLTPEQTQHFMQVYRKHYFSSENLVTLFAGIDALLKQLSQQGNKHLAIATGKSRAGLDRVLSHNPALKQYFISSRTADETQSKPHPQMLLELLGELDVKPQNAVMIGDTTYDVEMAHAAEMPVIAVTYGAHDEQTLGLAQPTHMVHTVSQLARLLGET
jgi:phosphoglycolate phosphatase